MPLGLFSLLRVFMLLTAVCLFGAVQARAAGSCISPHSGRGFTIQSGEIRLNPETREMQWRGRVATLGEIPYLILENLILADGHLVTIEDFDREGDRNAADRGVGSGHYIYGTNWVSVNIRRLKKILNEKFSPEFGERIEGYYARGFAWTSDQLLADAKKFDPNKLTYLVDKKRLFKGTTEIVLSHTSWLIMDRCVHNHFQPIMAETWKGLWPKYFDREISDNALTIAIARANQELAQKLGTDARVLPKAGGYGAGGWSLDSSFFDLDSMFLPDRNSTAGAKSDSK